THLWVQIDSRRFAQSNQHTTAEAASALLVLVVASTIHSFIVTSPTQGTPGPRPRGRFFRTSLPQRILSRFFFEVVISGQCSGPVGLWASSRSSWRYRCSIRPKSTQIVARSRYSGETPCSAISRRSHACTLSVHPGSGYVASLSSDVAILLPFLIRCRRPSIGGNFARPRQAI